MSKLFIQLPDGTHRIIDNDIYDQADALLDIGYDRSLPSDIPTDPQLFYEDFGFFDHPFLRDDNGRPVPVTKLTPYQYDFWKYPGKIIAIKSNKIGLTSSSLLECFHKALLPGHAGTEILIGAQDEAHANQHMEDLKMMIKNSKKYAPFLIEHPHTELLKEINSKVSVAFVENPWDKLKPTKIIALGQSPGRVFSWKRVSHILLSDISLMTRKDWEPYWRGIYSRVANTQGTIKIESVPNGQQGLVWQLFKLLSTGRDIADTDEERDTFVTDPEVMLPTFKLMTIPYREAMAANVITQEFIDDARRDLGELLFRETFECEFLPPGNQWYQDTDFKHVSYRVD